MEMLLECGRALAGAEVIDCIILPSRNGKHYDSVILYLDVSRFHLVRDCCGRSWEFVKFVETSVGPLLKMYPLILFCVEFVEKTSHRVKLIFELLGVLGYYMPCT